MTTTKSYDYLNRLLSISSVGSTGVPPVAADVSSTASFAYLYNDANQRVRISQADGTFWLYEYDKLGQLTSGKHYWSDNTPVAGQQYEYAYDDIGNRTSTKQGGDSGGTGLRAAAYSANSLNQYTSRDVPGAADIIGIAHPSASVTVNGSSPYRKGEYFWKELSINNTSAPVWQGVTNIASLSGTNQTNTGNLFLPKTTESFSYDADGNLTNDGHWTYTWDAENRLLTLTAPSSIPTGARQALSFSYDSQSRRLTKTVSNWTGSAWSKTLDQRFVYDGWNLVAELNATNNATVRSYLWGLDLSGTPQGAGGVGGLVAVNDVANGPYFTAYDGNGNVVALLKATDGTASGKYEHDPFGQSIRISGTAALSNPVRFSSKYSDTESATSYYNYRFLRTDSGRWLSRDPLEEIATRNIYSYVANDSIDWVDPFGLRQYDIWASAFIMPATITFPYISPPIVDLFATWAGNARGFGPGPLTPPYSKMAHDVVIESDPTLPALVSNGSVGGSSTVWWVSSSGPGTATAVSAPPALATVTRPRRCVTRVEINGSVTNPLQLLAPSIDYSYTFEFDARNGIATFNGRHDNYPWHEVYVNNVSLVTDPPLGPTYTPADLILSTVVPQLQFGIPRDCCKLGPLPP